ncbi:unnamed protein product [Rotaria sordida]|uniref:Uncharacterized protein n=1 Tax=Rotaria sordida TaxID=392033 RepID=A0A815CAY1_9BILA|nr:unnamed protein product [Rotaria sordida]CAF1278001.1 unnamed protein product [Rotaria sordida]
MLSFEKLRFLIVKIGTEIDSTVCSLPKQKLFDNTCQYLTIHVSAVVDVNHLWIQRLDRETNIQLKQINDLLSKLLIRLLSRSIALE